MKAQAQASSLAANLQTSSVPVDENDEVEGESKKEKRGKERKDKGNKEKNAKPITGPQKSAIQLAREKFAAAKAEKTSSHFKPSLKNVKGRGTGANAT